MPGCLFCDEYTKGDNTFLENELFCARWDGIPLTLGHAEILPKRHVQYFDELTERELSELLLFVKQVTKYIRDADMVEVYTTLSKDASELTRPYLVDALECAKKHTVAPDAFNHGLNDGPEAGQTIPHFHYHVIPRRQGDMENPRGGIRRMFAEDDYSKGIVGLKK